MVNSITKCNNLLSFPGLGGSLVQFSLTLQLHLFIEL